MNKEQMEWARQQAWFRSMRNVREYCGGEWYEVTVFDKAANYDCQFDHYGALVKWSSKQ